jgi:hypothetical protein
MTDAERSPIKDKPLRHAGQSLEEERRALVADKLEPFLFLAVFLAVIASMEWWRYFTDVKPSPVVFSFAAAIGIALAVWRFVRLKPKFRALRLGIEGEKVVGQYLERLRTNGFEVFHDVVAPGFNIDHVLVGPAGVFTIETKTWRKPVRGEARITFDGERLVAGTHLPDRDPIIQARAQASWLKNLLSESTGRRIDVHPVVVFPGWFIEQTPESRRHVWVLEPKALPAFLEHETRRLEPVDAKLVAFHLSRFVRSVERERGPVA